MIAKIILNDQKMLSRDTLNINFNTLIDHIRKEISQDEELYIRNYPAFIKSFKLFHKEVLEEIHQV